MSQILVTGEAKIRDIQGPVVSNSGVITALDGDASQYVRGDGTLADFPTSTGGGSSVSYYLNSSVSQGTIGGVAYRQLGKTPISGAGTDITISTTGYVASYLTDANDPALLEVPAGNFNCEFYFSVNNNTGDPFVYAEVYKYDGTTFTLIGTSVGVPEYITEGTVINPYYFAVPVSQSVLTVTDRIAIRIYVNVDGRTVTLHTENNHLCQVVTTFSKGLISLNNLTRQNQFFATGTSGTDFGISSSVATHTFNLPVASATNTGKLSSTDWSTFNGKVPYTGANANVDLAGFSLYLNNSQAVFGRNFTGTTAYALIGVNPFNQVSIDASALGTVFGGSLSGTGYIANGMGSQGGTIALKQNGLMSAGTGYTTLGSLSAGQLVIYFGDANLYAATFLNTSLTDSRSYTLPNASGTIALTSNLSSYVPYSGATTDVDLGNNTLLSKFVFIEGDGTFGGILSFKQYASSFTSTTDHTNIYATDTDKLNFNFFQVGGGKSFTFNVSSLTASTNRTYTMPNATGTLALTSDLSSYVPYTGATTNVDLGTNNITLFNITSNNVLIVKNTGSVTGTNGFSSFSGNIANNGFTFAPNNSSYHRFIVPTSNTYDYTFPNATGTIALLSGTQTFSGDTTFSNDLLVNGVRVGIGSGGSNNARFGGLSFMSNTTGSYNTAIGTYTLNANTTGSSNTALGNVALYLNTTGSNNTAIGTYALQNNTTGSQNTAIGDSSLPQNTTGVANISIGYASLSVNTSGNYNVSVGGGNGNALTTGSNNLLIGYNTGNGITTGSNNTIIGGSVFGLSATLANNIILADGAGNIRYQWNGTNNVFGNPISGTSATFSGRIGTSLSSSGANFNNSSLYVNNTANTKGAIFGYDDTNDRFYFTSLEYGVQYKPILFNTGAATFSSSVIANNNLSVIRSGSSVTTLGQSRYLNLNDYFGNTNARMEIGLGYFAASGVTNVPAIIGYLQTSTTDFTKGDIYFATRDVTSDTAPSERMRITSGGSVLIGKTTTSFGTVGTHLINNGQATFTVASDAIIYLNRTGSDGIIQYFYKDTGVVGSISVTASATAYNTSSDYRLKEDLKEIKGLEKVSAIKVYDFKWKADGSRMDGVIAHELAEVLPYAVQGEKDAEEMQQVDYSKLVPIMIKAIQELKLEIEQLKNK